MCSSIQFINAPISQLSAPVGLGGKKGGKKKPLVVKQIPFAHRTDHSLRNLLSDNKTTATSTGNCYLLLAVH